MTEPRDSKKRHQVVKIGVAEETNDLDRIIRADSLGDDVGIMDCSLFDKSM